MSPRVRYILGWVHLYLGLLLALDHPGTGAVFVVVGFAFWISQPTK